MTDNLPATLPEISTEIAAIEREIGTPAYWRDEGKQERYRGLLTRRAAFEVESEPESGAEDMFAIPAGVDMAQARAVGDILLDTPESERRELFDSFGALDGGVRMLMAAELVNRRTVAPWPFTDEDIAEVREVPAAQILAAEWGDAFWRKLSMAEGRIARLFAEFDKYETGERAVRMVTDWLLGLPAGSFAAVYRKLAAS